jgi:hypothetical protein
MDLFQQIGTEILIQLRGARNRADFSKHLGYTPNQYFKLESGYKHLRLNELIQVLESDEKIDFKGALNNGLDLKVNEIKQEEIIQSLVHKWGRPSSYVLENELQMSPSKWWRIRSGKVSVTFSDFLKLIDALTPRLFEFLTYFLKKNQLDQLREKKYDPFSLMSLYQKYPEAALITTGVYVEKYISAPISEKNQSLEEITKLSPTKLNFLIELLITHGHCYHEEGHLKVKAYKTEMRSQEIEAGKALFQYIQNKITQDITQSSSKRDDQYFCYKIAPVSSATKKEIMKEMNQCYLRVCELIEGDSKESKTDQLVHLSQGLF